jgi:hypothetical protein
MRSGDMELWIRVLVEAVLRVEHSPSAMAIGEEDIYLTALARVPGHSGIQCL